MSTFISLAWVPPQVALVSSVFHYTSGAGLLGMLQSGAMWATEASGLNDTAEILQGWDAVGDWLDAQPRTPAIEELKYLASLKSLVGPLRADLSFVLAASANGDDANQWRLYGDNGRGYAVELDTSEPLVVTTSQQRLPGPPIVGLEDMAAPQDTAHVSDWDTVSYTTVEIDLKMRSLVQWAEESNLTPAVTTPVRGADTARMILTDALAQAAATIKGAGFAGERELRVVVTFDFEDRHVEYHAGQFGVVRHALLTGSDGHADSDIVFPAPGGTLPVRRLPIRSVRLGPAHNARLGSPAVVSLLDRHGYSAPVLESAVALR